MNYLIAVLSDRIQAEDAYVTLEKSGIPKDQLTILGRGYQSADEFGLIDPNQQAKQQFLRLLTWLMPFGFAAGYGFNLATQITVIEGIGAIGNHVLGGLFGAIAGSMGAFFVGGGVGIAFGSGDALPYRNRLNAGKYLLVVKGSAAEKNEATKILRTFSPESLQGYSDR